jgi:S-phase kinase-associated protein 1
MSAGGNLMSSENIAFEVTPELKSMSKLFLSGQPDPLKLPIRSSTLEKVLEFCKHYEISPPSSIPKPLPSGSLQDVIPAWDFAFIELETDLLLELTEASELLKIQSLLDLCTAKLASLIRESSCEQIQKMFNIKD